MRAALGLALALALGACEKRYAAGGTLEIDGALSMATQLEVIRSRAIAQRVSRELGAAAELQLDEALRVRRRGDSQVIEIEVRDPDYRRAALLCNTIMKVYLDRRLELRRDRQMIEAQQRNTPYVPTFINDARVLDPCVSRR